MWHKVLSWEKSIKQAVGEKSEFQLVLCTRLGTELASSSDHPLPPADSETALADLALDMLRLLLMDHWGWLCTENIQKIFHLLFGTLIQR